MGSQFSSVAIVARDLRGSVVLAMSKKVYTTSPLQAEVETIFGVAQVANSLGLEHVCLESDSKLVIDALHDKVEEIPSRIRSCCAAVLFLFESQSSWVFNWVKRGANNAPYVLARWSLCHSY